MNLSIIERQLKVLETWISGHGQETGGVSQSMASMGINIIKWELGIPTPDDDKELTAESMNDILNAMWGYST